MRKIECPICSTVARMTRSAIRRGGLPVCGKCAVPFVTTDVETAEAVEDWTNGEWADARRREANAIVREARVGQGGSDRLRCGACSAFIASVDTLCGCGFQNAIRGHRNDGHYTSGAVSASNEMPF